MINCKHCGQPVDDSSAFCPKCGQKIEKFGQSAYQQTPPPHGPQTPPYGGQQQYQKPPYTTTPNGMKIRNMDMLEACKLYWTKYADFEGRARRTEFWWSQLMVFVISLLLSWTFIVPLAMVIPSLAITARRLHDIGKSGWWMLISLVPIAGSIVLLIWECKEGDIGRNQYGEDPKYIL